MRRYAFRGTVAVLTFIFGLAASAVTGLFVTKKKPADCSAIARLATAEVETRSRRDSCAWNRRLHTSPMLSIDAQPNEPLKLFYASTVSDGPNSDLQRVSFVLTNVSERPVKSYLVSFRSASASNSAASVSSSDRAADSILAPGESRTITIVTNPSGLLTAWVDSVDFTDGSQWHSPAHPGEVTMPMLTER